MKETDLKGRGPGDKYMKKPIIAVPMGDPAGIGPEIAARAAASETVLSAADIILVGDKGVMEKAIKIVGAKLVIREIAAPPRQYFRMGY